MIEALRRLHQGEQSFATEPYKTEVVDPTSGISDVAEQLRHAQEQIALTRQYPGRERSQPSERSPPKA